jgi:foldase protein PrsA
LNKISTISAFLSGLALAGALFGVAACKKSGAGAGGDETVAVVNNVPITKDEYLRYMMLKPTVTVQSNRGAMEARIAQPLGFQTLNDLVRQKLVAQMAIDEKVYPTDDEVTKEIEFRVQGDPNFVKRLNAQGLDPSMIKNALAVEMSQFNLLTKGITVTPAEIDKYIKDTPREFTQPEQVDLIWVLVRSEAQKKLVDEDLSRGQQFEETAMRFSEARDAKNNRGRVPVTNVKELDAELQGPISKTAPLASTNWIKDKDGNWAKFYVNKRIPAQPIKITDRIRELVRRKIMLQRGGNANDLSARLQAKLKESKVEVSMLGLKDDWDRAMKNMAAAAAPPSLEGAVGGATARAPKPGAGTPGATPPAAKPPTTAGGTTAGK